MNGCDGVPLFEPQRGSCLDVAGQSLSINLSFLGRALPLPSAAQERVCAGRGDAALGACLGNYGDPSSLELWQHLGCGARDFWAIESRPEWLSRHHKAALQTDFKSDGCDGKCLHTLENRASVC